MHCRLLQICSLPKAWTPNYWSWMQRKESSRFPCLTMMILRPVLLPSGTTLILPSPNVLKLLFSNWVEEFSFLLTPHCTTPLRLLVGFCVHMSQGWQSHCCSSRSSVHKIWWHNRMEASYSSRLHGRQQHIFGAVEWLWTNYLATKAILFYISLTRGCGLCCELRQWQR